MKKSCKQKIKHSKSSPFEMGWFCQIPWLEENYKKNERTLKLWLYKLKRESRLIKGFRHL